MKLRNVAIIAHVDHGKTTLVDALIRQSHTKLRKELASEDLIMDSNDLERERGITIFSKNASVIWQDTKINIIDTPGHADFGGEVERVLRMADGCLLLIDAQEGPMPQTRFVLKKALQMKLKIIVVINKIDKPNARISEVMNRAFDLFIELGADENAAYFPVMYACAKLGKAGLTPDLNEMEDITPLFEMILSEIPEPKVDTSKPFQMHITNIGYDNFKGRTATGRVFNGEMPLKGEKMYINRSGELKKVNLTSLMTFTGLERTDTEKIEANDIAMITGIPDITIGETLTNVNNPQALDLIDIEEPTVRMTFSINTSPFAGKEGQFSTSRQIRERLFKELQTDVALHVEETDAGTWIVSGRGELHLAILIERMRREGFEFQVSRPQAISKIVDGKELIPYEQVFIETPEIYQGAVIQELGKRHGEMKNMSVSEEKIVSLEFIIPTRGLFGFRSQFINDTHGLGIINTSFYDFLPDCGNWSERERGSLIVHESGVTHLYGLTQIQDRGSLFVGPGVEVYKGQVIGQNSRSNDISVNVCKEKKLSNMRSKGEGGMEHFNAPKTMDLEDSLEYIGDDELVEVTPKNVRIRKTILDEIERKRKMLAGIKV